MKGLKLKKIIELQNLNQQDLKKELVTSEKQLFEMRMKRELNELKQTHFSRPLRRYVAQIKTVSSEKGFTID